MQGSQQVCVYIISDPLQTPFFGLVMQSFLPNEIKRLHDMPNERLRRLEYKLSVCVLVQVRPTI